MEVKRRADWSGAWRMVVMRGQWTPMRRQSDWTVKIVVACCVALFFLSPGFSRMLSNDSTTYLGRNAVLERRSMMAHEVAKRSKMRERILHAVVDSEVDTGARREGAEDDLTNDYSTPTHNHSGDDESPSSPASKNTARSRGSQQFSRYTAQFGHRHLRGV